MASKFSIFGNKTNKVAHRRGKAGDSCHQRALDPKNVEKFETWSEAKAAGYRACGHCRPDKR